MDESQSNDVMLFRLTFSVDRDGFFRRSCRSCGRNFKTEVDEADLVTLLQPAFRRAGLEIGAEGSSESEEEEAQNHLYCPYCGHCAQSGDMLTQTFVSYLQRYAIRECVLPSINRVLSKVADESRRIGRGRSGGLLRISWEDYDPMLPPRPIAAPEPPDMMIVQLLCCGERIKILNEWNDLSICPYCGTTLVLH